MMNLVWVVIPLVLIGIVVMQDAEATVCHDFGDIFGNISYQPVILIGTVESSEIVEFDSPIVSVGQRTISERITEYKIDEQIYGDGVFELDTFTIEDSWRNPTEPYEIGTQRVIPLYYHHTPSTNQWNPLSCFVDFDMEYVGYVNWIKDLQKDTNFQYSYEQYAFAKYEKNNNDGTFADSKLGYGKSNIVKFQEIDLIVSATYVPAIIPADSYDQGILSLRIFDVNSNQTAQQVTLRVEILRDDVTLAKNIYFTLDGTIQITVHSNSECVEEQISQCTTYSRTYDIAGSTYTADLEQSITGPLFDKPGIYDIKITLESAIIGDIIFTEPLNFELSFELGENHTYTLEEALEIQRNRTGSQITNDSSSVENTYPQELTPEIIEEMREMAKILNLPPLKQFKIYETENPYDINCKSGLDLIVKKSNDLPACVKPETAEKLIQRGWAIS